MAYQFYNNCVNWNPSDVSIAGGLCDLIDSRISITRKTFLSKVDRADLVYLEDSLGYVKHYSQGLIMAKDWHVEYFKSKLHGEIVYGFRHSCIEFVFTQ